MKVLLQLGVIIVIGYVGWVFGMPLVKGFVGESRGPTSSPASGPGGRCVQDAGRASDLVEDRLLTQVRSLTENRAWEDMVQEVEFAVLDAVDQCRCALESCGMAKEALASLSEIIASGESRTSGSAPYEASRKHQKANQRLWEAYELAKKGR